MRSTVGNGQRLYEWKCWNCLFFELRCNNQSEGGDPIMKWWKIRGRKIRVIGNSKCMCKIHFGGFSTEFSVGNLLRKMLEGFAGDFFYRRNWQLPFCLVKLLFLPFFSYFERIFWDYLRNFSKENIGISGGKFVEENFGRFSWRNF